MQRAGAVDRCIPAPIAPDLAAMASNPDAPAGERPMLATLRRFLPYLWPRDAPGLRVRIVIALGLVVVSKLVQVYGAPFALQGAIDRMAGGSRDAVWLVVALDQLDRKSTRLNSSHVRISYAVFCLKKK